jgi:hypothetical protein
VDALVTIGAAALPAPRFTAAACTAEAMEAHVQRSALVVLVTPAVA